MAKKTMTHWNILISENDKKWEGIEGADGQLEQLTLASMESLETILD
ncbi:hypothetical protein [Candidatus Nitrospira salsa]